MQWEEIFALARYLSNENHYQGPNTWNGVTKLPGANSLNSLWSKVNKFVGPKARAKLSRANLSKKISLKVFAMLPGNSEKQSTNDIRQREGCYAATGWKTD